MKEFIKKIERINFGLMSPEDIRNMSVVRVETPDTYDSDGYPIENGLMDPRLGVLDPSLKCHTCGVRGGDCQGHFGSIELARPVLHVGFGDIIHKILRSTCNECGRVLLPEDVLDDYREKIAEAMHNKENLEDILKKLQNDAKKVELPENKQNEIVEKIMGQLYPEGIEYDDVERDDILIYSLPFQGESTEEMKMMINHHLIILILNCFVLTVGRINLQQILKPVLILSKKETETI